MAQILKRMAAIIILACNVTMATRPDSWAATTTQTPASTSQAISTTRGEATPASSVNAHEMKKGPTEKKEEGERTLPILAIVVIATLIALFIWFIQVFTGPMDRGPAAKYE